MSASALPSSAASDRWRVIILLGLTTFVAHFLLLTQFGLYEDDYFYTLPAFDWSWHDLWPQFRDAILHPIQGRPLNHAVRRVLFFLSIHQGGLQLAYLVSWAMVAVNATLLYRFARQTLSQPAALVAALVFITYPIDTSRQMLMHQSDLHFGAFLLLCALNLYAGERRLLATFVAALSLVNYESYYLPFIAAPLLVGRFEWRRLLIHGLTFFCFALGVLFLRRLLGESRAAEMLGGLNEVVGRMLAAGPIGMWNSLQAFVLRPVDALCHASAFAWTIGLAGSVIIFSFLRSPATDHSTSDPTGRAALAWVAVGGLVAWAGSYALGFRADYYPPIVSIGRLTGIHAPGTCGAGLVAGVVAEALFRSKQSFLCHTTRVFFGFAIGYAVAFGIEVQRSEYVPHWGKQLSFYRQVAELTADAKENDVVVIDAEGPREMLPITAGFPRFGIVNYSPIALGRFISTPGEWKKPPQFAVVWNDCPTRVTAEGMALFTPPWRYAPPADDQPLPVDVPIVRNEHFIYLIATDQGLVRKEGPVAIRGQTFTARARTTETNLRTTPLLTRLEGRIAPQDWFTLRNARNYPR